MIYLDYSAHTPPDSRVLKAYCDACEAYIGNPNSLHVLGEQAKEKMAETTEAIAGLLGGKPSEIIYTSGASESNNLALKGIARARRNSGKHIISTFLEHSSVSGTLTALQEMGYEIDLVGVNSDGRVDLQQLRELLRKDTILVSICAVDSELGVIQPVKEAADMVHAFNPDCIFHTDATQAIGKIPFIIEGFDCVSFAPHKFYGLNSSGILWKREGIVLEPLIHGGTSTTIYRSGTPDLPMALSGLYALKLAQEQLEERRAYVKGLNGILREELENYLLVKINSTEQSVPHILNLSVKGVKAEVFQQALSEMGVCVSTKSACSVAGLPSRAVFAVTRDKKNALCSWRISLSHLTTEEELSEFLTIFDTCYKELTK